MASSFNIPRVVLADVTNAASRGSDDVTVIERRGPYTMCGSVQTARRVRDSLHAGSCDWQGSAFEASRPADDDSQFPRGDIMQTLVFDVDGMTCGGCTGSVQRALSTLDGVSNVHVSLRPGSASMETDSSRVTSDQIVAVIGRLGYRARPRVAALA